MITATIIPKNEVSTPSHSSFETAVPVNDMKQQYMIGCKLAKREACTVEVYFNPVIQKRRLKDHATPAIIT